MTINYNKGDKVEVRYGFFTGEIYAIKVNDKKNFTMRIFIDNNISSLRTGACFLDHGHHSQEVFKFKYIGKVNLMRVLNAIKLSSKFQSGAVPRLMDKVASEIIKKEKNRLYDEMIKARIKEISKQNNFF